MHEDLKDLSLHLVLTITDTKINKKMYMLLEEAHIPMRYQCRALGTANSELLNLCGLGELDRILTLFVLPKKLVPVLFKKMSSQLHLKKKGTGVAVSIPLTGVQIKFAKFLNQQNFHSNIQKYEEEVQKMSEESVFSMILIAVNQGFSDEVVDTARKAGAKGGTVIKGRRVGMDEAVHFWGISFQEEQEIVFIIVPKEMKKDVMAALCHHHGIHSPAHGMIMSLPVSDVLGIEK